MPGSLYFIYGLWLLWRILWFYLPEGLSAILDGELSWSELFSFMLYINHVDCKMAVRFEGAEAPYKVSNAA